MDLLFSTLLDSKLKDKKKPTLLLALLARFIND
ncbi:MAG: hypothetical protein ACJASU_001329 [Cognaticolwellia sp.]|jgi:hypothetical protein